MAERFCQYTGAGELVFLPIDPYKKIPTMNTLTLRSAIFSTHNWRPGRFSIRLFFFDLAH